MLNLNKNFHEIHRKFRNIIKVNLDRGNVLIINMAKKNK